MYCVSVGASNGLRLGLLGLASIIALVAVATDPAEARGRRKRHSASDYTVNESRYADIVVDVNSGETLHEVNPDGLRYPASLTKIMTLYLLFERLESGKIKLNTPLKVSANAAEQAPSKLGLDDGDTIDVEDAIKALVTKSANDVAVVVAEALGGTEENFAKLMTRKARTLAMKHTIYKNASGLPDEDQVTTARDQALLGVAVQERFPRYYQYFATPQFTYHGNTMRNHNRLLGRVAGVDGIKTGYTRASGFNLVTSVRRDNRHIVAVVLGGNTGGQRDARMRALIDKKISVASTTRSKTKVAQAADQSAEIPIPPVKPRAAPVAAAPAPAAAPVAVKQETATTAAIPAARPQLGSTDPIQPRLVKTLSVKAGSLQTASLESGALPPSHTIGVMPRANPPAEGREASGALLPPPAGARPGVLGVLSVKSPAEIESAPAPVQPAAAPIPSQVTAFAAEPALEKPPASAAQPVRIAAISASATIPDSMESKPRSGWIIQVGAFDDESEAKQRLNTAQNQASDLLRKADPFTEPVTKGDKKLYRARFAGLDRDRAEAACKQLKRNDIACFTTRN